MVLIQQVGNLTLANCFANQLYWCDQLQKPATSRGGDQALIELKDCWQVMAVLLELTQCETAFYQLLWTLVC